MFVRFPDPGDDPWVAVHEGYEIQIHDTADEPIHQTVASTRSPRLRRWRRTLPDRGTTPRIECIGQTYRVVLNGLAVTQFTGGRGTAGHVGLQYHDPNSVVRFRRAWSPPSTERGRPS